MFSLNLFKKLTNGIILPIILILLLTLTSGCSIQLISDYDELIDRYATEMQSGIETFLIKMERLAGTAEGTYERNIGFYEEIQGTLATLALRAEMLDDNKIVAEQIVLLQKNLDNLRELHELQGEKGLSQELAEPMKVAFNTQFKAIIKLQNALKRGVKNME